MNKKTVFLNVQKITYLIFYLTIYFLSNHLMKRYSWMMNNGYSIEVIFGAFRKIESKIGNCMRRKFFHIFLPRNKMKIKPVQAPSLLNQSPCEKTFREVRTFFDSNIHGFIETIERPFIFFPFLWPKQCYLWYVNLKQSTQKFKLIWSQRK